MEGIYAKRDGAVDEPHRHDFFTVLVVKRAKGVHNDIIPPSIKQAISTNDSLLFGTVYIERIEVEGKDAVNKVIYKAPSRKDVISYQQMPAPAKFEIKP